MYRQNFDKKSISRKITHPQSLFKIESWIRIILKKEMINSQNFFLLAYLLKFPHTGSLCLSTENPTYVLRK